MPFVPDDPTGSGFTADSAPQTPPKSSTADMMSAGYGEGMGQVTPHQVAVMGRGIAGGAAGVVTVPADVGIWAGNKINKGMGNSTLDTNAGDLVQKGLTAAGFPEADQPGDKAVETTGSLVAGLLTGGIGGGKGPILRGATQGKDPASMFSTLSNADSAQNLKILTNSVARDMGAGPYIDKLTPDVMEQLGRNIGNTLDQYRSPNTLYLYQPHRIAQDIQDINSQWTGKTNLVANSDIMDRVQTVFNSNHVTGADLGELSTQLRIEQSAAAAKSEHGLSEGIAAMRDKVEGLIKTGLNPEDKQAYESALQKYGTKMDVLDGGNLRGGYIQPSTYYSFMERADPMGLKATAAGSSTYQILRQIGGQLGAPDLGTGGSLALTKSVAIMKALARTAPGLAQQAMQVGIPTAVRAARSAPGFDAALLEEMENAHRGLPDQSQ